MTDAERVDIVFAVATAWALHPKTGESWLIRPGQHWPADDPIVVTHPKFFTDDLTVGMTTSRRVEFVNDQLVTGGAPVESSAGAPRLRRRLGGAPK